MTAAAGGCSSQTGVTNVLVRSLPTAVVSGSREICAGRQANVTAALTGAAPWSITWSDGDLQADIGASPATRLVEPASTTTYSVAALSDAYCHGTASGSAVITVGGSCGAAFYTVAPCRVVDTRGPAGAFGGPALQGAKTRSFTLTGQCGVPAGAKAVALNVTVVGATMPGFLTLYPAGDPLPGSSTINFTSGQVRANNTVCELGTGGAVAVLFGSGQTASVQMILDVTGYFE